MRLTHDIKKFGDRLSRYGEAAGTVLVAIKCFGWFAIVATLILLAQAMENRVRSFLQLFRH